LTVVSVMTGCVDDKYDLSDIDTTSRFTVDNLTVPVNLSEIKLKNVVNLDDNENIQKVGDEYAIVKHGDINPTEFSIAGIHVNQPTFDPSDFEIKNVPGGGVHVPGQYDVPAIDLPQVALQNYEFKMEGVDNALKVLEDIKTADDIEIKVVLTIKTQELLGANASISFKDLNIQLPWGLITDNEDYDQKTGMLIVNDLPVEAGSATLTIKASGLDLDDKGTIVDGNLGIEGKVGIDSGKIKMSVNDIDLPSNIDIQAEYYVSGFDIASFSGNIDYKMDDINIAPISLSDLPDFLDSSETKLFIANPQILVEIHNPVYEKSNGKLIGQGQISLTSEFKNESIERASEPFFLDKTDSKLAFCTPSNDGGFTFVKFDGLRDVLTALREGENPETYVGQGLPESIHVNIHDITFSGEVTDFPLGDLGSASGSYDFTAPLGFGQFSRVVYESTEDGWGGDDLDKVNITKIHLNALCSTNLPVSVQLSVVPVDKNGDEIKVDENSGKFHVSANSSNEPVELLIQAIGNGTIKNFDGVKFKAIIAQDSPDNTEAIGPDLQIALKDIKVTVDGYYETDF
ncbi:MAG: hypothetical protein K2N48_11975, partial [Muribaculaceae bacterium]|nr:hypothetical protein [Muribaculaceae bacterium]